jgi:hypothetical protein
MFPCGSRTIIVPEYGLRFGQVTVVVWVLKVPGVQLGSVPAKVNIAVGVSASVTITVTEYWLEVPAVQVPMRVHDTRLITGAAPPPAASALEGRASTVPPPSSSSSPPQPATPATPTASATRKPIPSHGIFCMRGSLLPACSPSERSPDRARRDRPRTRGKLRAG